ncbi:MAG: glycosyltransferase family 87 protein [Candidatus Sumerlaeia bacterium]
MDDNQNVGINAVSGDNGAKKPFSWKRMLFWLAIFLAVAGWYSISDYRFSNNSDDWRIRGDFTNYSFAASRVLMDGGDPYDQDQVGKNYKYFPLNALLLAPLTPFPIPVAQGLFLGINALLLIWAIMAHRELAGPSRIGFLGWLMAFLFGGRYILISIQLGQWNLPVYTLTILGLWQILAQGHRWRGALLVGLATGIKFMPGFFIFYFLIKKQYKTALALVVCALFWILIFPSIFLGPQRHVELLKTYHAESVDRLEDMVGDESVVGHSLSVTIIAYLTEVKKHSVHRFGREINILDLPLETSSKIAHAVCFILLGMTLYILWRRRSAIDPGKGLIMELGFFFVMLLLISPEVRKAQFIGFFTAGMGLGMHMAECAAPRWERRLAWGVFVASALLMVFSSAILPRAGRNWMHAHGSLTLVILLIFISLGIILWRKPKPLPDKRPS